MYLCVGIIGKVYLLRKTAILSAFVENGACLRPPMCVCVFPCMLYIFVGLSSDLNLTSLSFFCSS